MRGTSSTGTTRPRWRRCIPDTCPPSTAAISRPRSSHWRRACWRSPQKAADPAAAARRFDRHRRSARAGIVVATGGRITDARASTSCQPPRAGHHLGGSTRAGRRRRELADRARERARADDQAGRRSRTITGGLDRDRILGRRGRERVAALNTAAAGPPSEVSSVSPTELRRWPRACGSTFCTIVGDESFRSAIVSPTPRDPVAWTPRSTICWLRKRGWPASSRSPKATSRSITGSTSDAWSPTSMVEPRSCRGAARCSST